jgi:uncharacterized protein (TIGR00251 family)
MRVSVRVKPRAGRSEVVKKGGIYVVNLKSAPENGKANVELVKLLHKYFNKPVRIKSGFTSRNKIVEVEE